VDLGRVAEILPSFPQPSRVEYERRGLRSAQPPVGADLIFEGDDEVLFQKAPVHDEVAEWGTRRVP